MGCLCSKTAKKPFDPLGTPMPDTPSTQRRYRNGDIKVGYGALGGLERELSESGRKSVKWNSKPNGKSDRSGNPNSGVGGPGDSENSPLLSSPDLMPLDGVNPNAVNSNGTSMGQLTDKYVLKEVLGVGSTSTCHRCVSLATNQSFACKIIDKRHIESRFRGLLSQFNVEIEVLRELRHDGIIKLEDVYVTAEKIYMVMELMGGGELFDYVVEKGTLTEEEASAIVNKVTSAVVYMHQLNIIHRDMKPENLLLVRKPSNPGDIPSVKIIDFGLSKFLHDDPSARSFLGTRGYLAPEMLQRRDYNKAVDIWALGVIVFVLLCGCLPFDDDSTVPTDAAVKEKFVLRFPRWARNLSESAKDLLQHLLDCDPATRYTAEQALAHPWVAGRSVKKGNFLQSPRIIKTPRTPAGVNTNARTKDRVAQLVNVRKKEGSHANKKEGPAGGMVRKNSI